MKAKVLTNEEMYRSIPSSVLSRVYLIEDKEYRFLKAVRIAKSLGLTEITTGDDRKIIINKAISFLKDLASKRVRYYQEEHDRSRTEWKQCDNCGNWHEPDGMLENWQGNFVCEDCAENEFSTCDNCGNLVHDDDVTCTEDTSNSYSQTFCPNCEGEHTFECDCCRGIHHVDDRCSVNNGWDEVCIDCRDEYYSTCDSCGDTYNSDDMYYNEHDGCHYCESCYEDRASNRGVNNYGYKPSPVFYGKASHYFGIEIECEPKDIETADLAENIEPVMYLKEDSSLNDEGVEIVSHPMSFDYIHNELDWSFLDDVKGWIKNYGIHIHVCRKAFKNQLHIEKVINFFALEPEFINAIAQRNSDRWAKIQEKKGLGDKRSRYTAVNQSNQHTIEFRVFQTSCRKDRVLKNIQFVEALIKYCGEPILISEMSKDNFYKYVSGEKDRYPELFAYMGEINNGASRMKR